MRSQGCQRRRCRSLPLRPARVHGVGEAGPRISGRTEREIVLAGFQRRGWVASWQFAASGFLRADSTGFTVLRALTGCRTRRVGHGSLKSFFHGECVMRTRILVTVAAFIACGAFSTVSMAQPAGKIVLPGATKEALKAMPAFQYAKIESPPKPKKVEKAQ